MSAPSPDTTSRGEWVFSGLAGLILAVGLLKYGNPVIFDSLTSLHAAYPLPETAGGNFISWLIGPWPLRYGYVAIFLLALSGFLTKPTWRSATSTWLLLLPALWFGCQLVSNALTINARLSGPVVRHFFICVVWFYLGVFGMSAVRRPRLLLAWLSVGFAIVVVVGWEQRWGGLEETRRYFYELPNWREFPPAFLAKLASNRIYGTLFYPNALAGAILLFLPLSLVWLWHWTVRWEFKARVFMTGLLGVAALACLYWSQSKAGWLIFLAMVGVVFLRLPYGRVVKLTVIGLVLLLGLGGFFLRYANYFSRGATSVTARFDYWRAAVLGVQARPLVGTGPGTFMTHYARVKHPDAEMARLAHNDYLQQACDSGIPAALAYLVFVWGSLIKLYRQRTIRDTPILFALWLGLLGLAIQSLVEFGLYIPALSWPFFFFFGWLLSNRRSDTLGPDESPVPKRA